MATQKIIYFTAGEVATTEERAEIAALNAKAVQPYEVTVMRGDDVASYSYGAGLAPADFVAGTIPDAYDDAEDYPVFDIDDEPVDIDENDTIAVENSAGSNTVNGTASIDDGVVTIVLDATDQIVSHGDTVVVKNSAGTDTKNGTATVASGVISGVALAATEAIVSNTENVTVNNSADSVTKTGVATVSAGAVSKVNLPSTEAIVSNSMALTGVTPSGSYTNTVTFTVANGVITGIVLS